MPCKCRPVAALFNPAASQANVGHRSADLNARRTRNPAFRGLACVMYYLSCDTQASANESHRMESPVLTGTVAPSSGASRVTSQIRLADGSTFLAARSISILDAALQAQLTLDHSCRSGRCGACKTQVISGKTRLLPALKAELAIAPDEARDGWILTCAREALTDTELSAEAVPGPPSPAPRTLPCRIDTVERVAPDVLRVRLRLPPNAAFTYRPGQSIDLIGPGGLKRPYSIANDDPADPHIELHIRRVAGGAMSAYWFDRAQPHDLLRLHGPRGSFVLRDVAGQDLVLLATGTGYAPIRSLLGQIRRLPADQQPARVRMFWGARQVHELYESPQASGLDWQFVPLISGAEPAWTGARGHVQHSLLEHGFEASRCVVYACGSPAMVDGARALLAAKYLSKRRFHFDAFVAAT